MTRLASVDCSYARQMICFPSQMLVLIAMMTSLMKLQQFPNPSSFSNYAFAYFIYMDWVLYARMDYSISRFIFIFYCCSFYTRKNYFFSQRCNQQRMFQLFSYLIMQWIIILSKYHQGPEDQYLEVKRGLGEGRSLLGGFGRRDLGLDFEVGVLQRYLWIIDRVCCWLCRSALVYFYSYFMYIFFLHRNDFLGFCLTFDELFLGVSFLEINCSSIF